jgi:hypothetical protein
MKLNAKKMLLMAAMVFIMLASLLMIQRHNLIGQVGCVALTAILFRLTQTKHNPTTRP